VIQADGGIACWKPRAPEWRLALPPTRPPCSNVGSTSGTPTDRWGTKVDPRRLRGTANRVRPRPWAGSSTGQSPRVNPAGHRDGREACASHAASGPGAACSRL